jgi:hypothetical protein
VVNILEAADINFQEYFPNGNLIVAKKVQVSSSAVPLITD